jgi:hypothetical protein
MFAYWMQVLCYTFLKCFNHLLLFIDMAAAEGCTGRIAKALKQSWNSPPIILSNRVHGGCNNRIKRAKDVLYRGNNYTKGQAPRTFRGTWTPIVTKAASGSFLLGVLAIGAM